MPSHYLYLFWGTAPLIVPSLVERLGTGSGRWGSRFKAAAPPAMALLLFLLPKTTLTTTAAALGSIGVCAVVLAAFAALHPPARREIAAVAALIPPILAAALGVIRFTVQARLGTVAFSALMTLTIVGVIYAGGWMVKRIRRARAASTGVTPPRVQRQPPGR